MSTVPLPLTIAVVLSLGAAPSAAQAQSYNFDNGNDTGWTHLNPLGKFGVSASYSFPDGGYRMSLPAFNHPQLSYSRAASLLEGTSYSEFHESVDATAWSPNTSFGLLARVGNIGLGQTTGYSFFYNSQQSRLFVAFHVAEVAYSYSGTSVPMTLDPQKQYRMTFDGIGNDLTGSIFDLAHPGAALATISITDHATTNPPDNTTHLPYLSGFSGLLLANVVGPASVTYDNYSVSAVPEPMSTGIASGFGLVALAAWHRQKRRKRA